MKTTLSILLLGLLIFNTMGFSFYTICKMDSLKEVNLASNDTDLVLKFPMSIPYLTDWQSSELSDDEILKGNEYYKITSKKIVNDTLFVHCEFSQTSRERFWSLVSSFDDHLKTSNAHKGNPSLILKNFLKEYMALGRKHTFYFFEWSTPATYRFVANKPLTPYFCIQTPPPDLV